MCKDNNEMKLLCFGVFYVSYLSGLSKSLESLQASY